MNKIENEGLDYRNIQYNVSNPKLLYNIDSENDVKSNITNSNNRSTAKKLKPNPSEMTQSTDIMSINGQVKDWIASDLSQKS